MTTSGSVTKLIRRARLSRGYSDTEASNLIGVSIDEYWDIEHHEDEIETAVSLATVLRLCTVLGIELSSVIKIDRRGYPRINDPAGYVASKRVEKGMSVETLSDLVGFESSVIFKLESESNFGASLPVMVLREIEDSLSMAKGDLVFADWK